MTPKISRAKDVLLTFWCPYCGAPPGEKCRTPKGSPTTYMHELRFRKAVFAGALPLPEEIDPQPPVVRIVPHDD